MTDSNNCAPVNFACVSADVGNAKHGAPDGHELGF
jgi:hypothetical protein